MKCQICKNQIKSTHKFCSKKCYWKSLEGLKNEKAPNWRGNKAGIQAIHNWLEVNFGKFKICEGKDCRKKSNVYEWCLKTNYKYKKNKNNFLRLCRSCHRRYDFTLEKKEKAIKNLIWYQNVKTK